jgi:hypothetical protein
MADTTGTPKSPYDGLPPYPTIGEMIAEIGDVARRNLQGKAPHQQDASPEEPAN